MIQVLNIVGSFQCGGVGNTIMSYYRNIDRSKIQFDFLVADDGEDYYEKEAILLGARVFRRPIRTKDPVGNIKGLIKVLKNHPEIKIVHIHNFYPIVAIDALIAMFCGVPVRIAHSRSAPPIVPLSQKIFQPLLRATTNYWLGCSTEAGVSFLGKAAKESGRLIFFPNARDYEPYRYSQERRDAVRKEMGLDGHFVLFNAGRLCLHKNQGFLIEAFSVAYKKRPELVLLIAGKGELESSLIQKARELGLGDSLRLLGHRDDMPDLLQAVDVLVLPSLQEGMPGVVIEAQVSGLPCLISDTVTPECKVTDLAEFLPIDKGVEVWAEQILQYKDFERHDMLDDVLSAGYDIKQAAKRMENLYLDAFREKAH